MADPDLLAMTVGSAYVGGVTSEALRPHLHGPEWLPYVIGASIPVAVGITWQATAFQIGGRLHPIDYGQVVAYATGAAFGAAFDYALHKNGVLQ